MKAKKSLIVSLMALVIALSGCNFDLNTDLYIQDIIELPSFDELLYGSATIAIGYAPDEPEDQEKLQQLMIDTFRNARDFREEERNYTTYTLFDIDLLILGGSDHTADLAASPASEDIFSIFVEYGENLATLYAVLNESKYKEFQTLLKDEYWQDVTLEDANIIVNLINDTRESVSTQLFSVYANNTPYPYSTTITMGRRDEVAIKFSNVLRDSLEYTYDDDTGGFRTRVFGTVILLAE
ncbi:MAG: hypothetical protein JXB47_18830 [Anaerolineae bacterium]|nr:hypothetical protein [Anaerolineae bacterium]